jgi:putative transposase
MKKSRYTEEQIVGILKESEAGLPTAELCRKYGISEQTLYRWKAKYGGLEVSEAQRLRQLEEENRKLKQLVAEQALDIVGFKARSRRGVSRSCGVLGTACLWATGSAASDVTIPAARNPFRGSERRSACATSGAG